MKTRYVKQHESWFIKKDKTMINKTTVRKATKQKGAGQFHPATNFVELPPRS